MHCKPNLKKASHITVAIVFTFLAGCSTSMTSSKNAKFGKSEATEEVRAADALFQKGLYTEAIIQCIEIARVDPLTPGLADLQGRIQAKIAEERFKAFAVRDNPTTESAAADATRMGMMPETYRLRRHVLGETDPLRTELSPMQKALKRRVTVNLVDVNLADIVAQIGDAENINIVADGAAGEDQTVTIRAVDTPLEEILEFVGRNLDVTFSVGQNLIWVTARVQSDESGVPLETRVYRLRKGLSGDEIENAPDGIGIIETVKRFVPQTEGADIYFSQKAHALLVKNTRENLIRTEDIINALDVKPVQVLIEARFMSTTIADLRELGIDWVLDSPININKKREGRWSVAPPTKATWNPVTQSWDLDNAFKFVATRRDSDTQVEISKGGGISGGGFPTENIDTGLNMTFAGILTDPQFKAVLHALQKSGKTRTLTAPRVTTVNNKEAKIRIGKDLRYFENFTRSDRTEYVNGVATTTSSLEPEGTPTVEELGYELKATPSVGSDLATINLRLLPSISDVLEWNYFALQGTNTIALPVFSRSEIDTELVVRSGETVIMGGLAKTLRGKSRTGIPFLSNLPFIGYLFGSDINTEDIDNLIIFVTATIISDEGEEMIPLNAREVHGTEVPLSEAQKVLESRKAAVPEAPVLESDLNKEEEGQVAPENVNQPVNPLLQEPAEP